MAQPTLGAPQVGDVYQVHLKSLLHEQTIRMVLHYRLSVVGPGIDADRWAFYNTIFQKLDSPNNVFAKLRACQSNDVDYEYIRVQKVWPLRSVFRQFDYLFGGAQVQDSAPANIALAITKRTGEVGRHGHGVTHLAGLPQNLIINSAWNVGAWALAEEFADSLAQEQSGAGGEYTLVPCLAPDNIPPIGAPFDVVGVHMSQEVRTMYRRTRGIGE